MPLIEDTAMVCPDCGTRAKNAYSSNLGRCMICLLRAGFAEASEEVQGPMTDRFGPYVIDHRENGKPWELGHGAMGVTYRAVDSSLQRPVALKLINTDVANSEARERFIREARLAASLRHTNVATVHHFGIQEETGQYFCAMELLEGETLDERVRRTGPLDVRSVAAIARQITAALVEAEKRGLVHRDLKPANIMVLAADTNEPKPEAITVKVIDFGIAKALAETLDARVLTHGGFVGTPAFASPEQLGGNPVDVRSDTYSLGATLWYLLTGHMPFGDRQSGSDHVEAKRDLPLVRPPLQQLKAARVPSAFISLLLAMLEIEPAARPSVRELADRLEKIQLADRGKKVRRYALLGGLLASAAAVALSFFYLFGKHQSEPLANPLEKGIAVLPFENLSDDPHSSYFAEGVENEILTDLARIADLKVISRDSARLYPADKPRHPGEIGRQLGVAYLLEGSVQRWSGRLRINAQLIDARADSQLWAQSYDRDGADLFTIQSDIARTVATQLRARLSADEKAALTQAPTGDLEANELYLRGMALAGDPTNKYNQLQAVKCFEQAIARDAHFLRAYCELARVHLELFAIEDHTPERLQKASAVIGRAAQLQPDAGEVHLIRGRYLSRGLREHDQAREEIELAQRALPNDSGLYFELALLDERQARWNEMLKNFRRALELNPKNIEMLYHAARAFSGARHYREATQLARRALSLSPDKSELRIFIARQPIAERADLGPLRSEFAALLTETRPGDYEISDRLIGCAILLRDFAAAERVLMTIPPEGFTTFQSTLAPREWYVAYIARSFNQPQIAREAFAATQTKLEEHLRAHPNDAQSWSLLGLTEAALDHKEKAIAAGQHACELWPSSKEPALNSMVSRALAVIYAWVGEKNLALQKLREHIGEPMFVDYGDLNLDPDWDPLRGDPGFEKIVATLAPK